MFLEGKTKIDGKIKPDQYSKDSFMNLEMSYQKTVEELGLQQTKRDQIIALYLSILGFVIPNIIGLDVQDIGKGFAFFVIYLIGILFCRIVIRYRIYKEVYWISCRVISQLYNIVPEQRNKETVQTLFFRTMEKNAPSVAIKNRSGKISKIRSFKKQLGSAEMMLFNILLLFASFIGCISVVYFCKAGYNFTFVIAVVLLVYIFFNFSRLNNNYITSLLNQYKCVSTGKTSDLSVPFNKAWTLHCYVDDDEYDPQSDK